MTIREISYCGFPMPSAAPPPPPPPLRFWCLKPNTHTRAHRRVGEDDDGHLTNYYKIRATTFYSGGSDVEYRKRLYFSSSARSSIYDCRVDLRIGGDYLLSLFHNTSRASDTEYSDQGGALTVNACALDKPWTSVFDTEKEELARLLERNDDEEYGYYDDDDSGRKLRGMMA